MNCFWSPISYLIDWVHVIHQYFGFLGLPIPTPASLTTILTPYLRNQINPNLSCLTFTSPPLGTPPNWSSQISVPVSPAVPHVSPLPLYHSCSPLSANKERGDIKDGLYGL